ncbi:MAG: metal-dependent transcriptional regulator [Salibacteraceae bacterium]
MGQSRTEEDYLKTIYMLSRIQPKGVGTKSIGDLLNLKLPSVSDMLRKLGAKKLIEYTKYKGVTLTEEGEKIALLIIRKHRLWETFLVEHFNFKWDEVHDIAEDLEHINSVKLIDQLDKFLGYPKFDPHGDPIPDKNGVISLHYDKTLNQIKVGQSAMIVGVKDHSSDFLKFLESVSLTLGTMITVTSIIEYDKSLMIKTNNSIKHSLSQQVCKNLYVK